MNPHFLTHIFLTLLCQIRPHPKHSQRLGEAVRALKQPSGTAHLTPKEYNKKLLELNEYLMREVLALDGLGRLDDDIR